MSESISPSDKEMTGSTREYLIYFIGLEEQGTVSLNDFASEMPYENSDIAEDLEYLEKTDIMDSYYGKIKPIETKGFNKILEDTHFSETEETEYYLSEKGKNHMYSLELDKISRQLKETFQ